MSLQTSDPLPDVKHVSVLELQGSQSMYSNPLPDA
jgi:hypothetical protein